MMPDSPRSAGGLGTDGGANLNDRRIQIDGERAQEAGWRPLSADGRGDSVLVQDIGDTSLKTSETRGLRLMLEDVVFESPAWSSPPCSSSTRLQRRSPPATASTAPGSTSSEPVTRPRATPRSSPSPDARRPRGLLFINYQASIARIFEFVQSRWATAKTSRSPATARTPSSARTPPTDPH